MSDPQHVIFLHGLYGSSQGFKASFLRSLHPGILTPDFQGSLEERLAQLEPLLEGQIGWIIVGSSFGGLLGALYTCLYPQHVKKLILLAPAILWPDFASDPPGAVSVPTIIYHGKQDEILPPEDTRSLAERIFENLTFHLVDDDHKLHATVEKIDWSDLLRA